MTLDDPEDRLKMRPLALILFAVLELASVDRAHAQADGKSPVGDIH
jgi:hypothetical protein